MDPHIKQLFDDAHLAPEGERAKRTLIVNELFEKKGQAWKVCFEKPLFKEAKTRSLMSV